VSISLSTGSVVAKAGQQISLSSLGTVTSGNNPTYLVVSLLDRNEYTASSNGNTGTLSGDGNTAHFSSIGGDSNTIGGLHLQRLDRSVHQCCLRQLGELDYGIDQHQRPHIDFDLCHQAYRSPDTDSLRGRC